MVRAFVSVGSNIDPERNMSRAIGLLVRQIRIVGISTVYLTEPVGRPEQQPYYNCVVAIETMLSPLELKTSVLRPLEDELGRTRGKDESAPRSIDLDLMLYDDLVVKTGDLILPDPEIGSRAFLAKPLHELAPDLVLPDSKEPIASIASKIPGDTMKPLIAYTNRLKRETRHEY